MAPVTTRGGCSAGVRGGSGGRGRWWVPRSQPDRSTYNSHLTEPAGRGGDGGRPDSRPWRSAASPRPGLRVHEPALLSSPTEILSGINIFKIWLC